MKIIQMLPVLRKLESNTVYHLIFKLYIKWAVEFSHRYFCPYHPQSSQEIFHQLVCSSNENKSWYHGCIEKWCSQLSFVFPCHSYLCSSRTGPPNHRFLCMYGLEFSKKYSMSIPLLLTHPFQPAQQPRRWVLFCQVQQWRVWHYTTANQRSFLKTSWALGPPWGYFFGVVMSFFLII